MLVRSADPCRTQRFPPGKARERRDHVGVGVAVEQDLVGGESEVVAEGAARYGHNGASIAPGASQRSPRVVGEGHEDEGEFVDDLHGGIGVVNRR
jgi:hypothetical protein